MASDPSPTLAQLAERLGALEARNADLEEEVRRLSAPTPPVVRGTGPTHAPAHVPTAPPAGAPLGRRSMLRTGLAAGAAAAAVTVVGTSSPAAADNGDTLKMGQGNFASSTTKIGHENGAQGSGVLITDNYSSGDVGNAALTVNAAAGLRAAGIHVEGQSQKGVNMVSAPAANAIGLDVTTGAGIAAWAVASSGYGAQLYSSSGTALYAQSTTGIGAVIYGQRFQLFLGPVVGRDAPVTDPISHTKGEIVVDGYGDMWLCVQNGTPGTWRKVAGPATSGSLHLLPAPARVYDSRPLTSPTAVGPKTPFNPNETRTFDLKVNSSGVPAGATGVIATLLLVNAAATSGNMTIWANGVTKPLSNSLVWGGSVARFTTLAVTAVDAQARVQINASARTDLVLDIIGYYR